MSSKRIIIREIWEPAAHPIWLPTWNDFLNDNAVVIIIIIAITLVVAIREQVVSVLLMISSQQLCLMKLQGIKYNYYIFIFKFLFWFFFVVLIFSFLYFKKSYIKPCSITSITFFFGFFYNFIFKLFSYFE